MLHSDWYWDEMGIYVTQVSASNPNILWFRSPDLLLLRI
jgi:hypothetical protein